MPQGQHQALAAANSATLLAEQDAQRHSVRGMLGDAPIRVTFCGRIRSAAFSQTVADKQRHAGPTCRPVASAFVINCCIPSSGVTLMPLVSS